jgi:isopropylmalate/homocitrate/citramalate synthase
MIYFNNKRNLIEEHIYEPSLQDVYEPNLFREVFDYGSVPKVAFNLRNVPIDMPDNIWITDTTFRDGQQGMFPLTAEQICDMYKLLNRLGGPNGMIRQSEFFIYTEKDREALIKCRDLGLKFPEITSWIRATEGDFDLVKNLGLKETGILVSCSDYHIFKKMGWTRKQAIERYLTIVKKALEKGILPRCHFEDITRADIYGFVIPFAIELMKLAKSSKVPIKIRACDTMGYGVTYPGSSVPRCVQGIIYCLHHYADVPSEQMEWHGHNDFYKAVVNSSTAWLYGCSAVSGTLLGIGERTGNTPIEAMIMEYCALRGDTNGMDLPVITEIAEYFENELGYEIPPNTPFVGNSFNVTRAGIHADGLLKDEEIYNIFDTDKLLHRPPLVAVDVFSGLAGITFWANNYYRLPNDEKLDKKSAAVAAVKEKVDALYAAGRNTTMSNSELNELFEQCDPELHNKLMTIRIARRKKVRKSNI